MKMQNALHATDAMAQIRAAKRKQEMMATHALARAPNVSVEAVTLE